MDTSSTSSKHFRLGEKHADEVEDVQGDAKGSSESSRLEERGIVLLMTFALLLFSVSITLIIILEFFVAGNK